MSSPTLPVPDILTVIITTSPTPSAPSTELLSTVLDSFRDHCPGLRRCRVIVVFDAYDQIVERARLKKGYVTPEEADNYDTYKANVKKLVTEVYLGLKTAPTLDEGHGEAEYGSSFTTSPIPFTTHQTPDRRLTFLEPAQRLGFGLAVRSALRLTETPFVWIQQHDWTLCSTIPLAALLSVMQCSAETATSPTASPPDTPPPVKYICFPSTRMLSYAVSQHVVPFPALRAVTAISQRTFPATATAVDDVDVREQAVPLTPLFLWHDKPHLAATAHYLARVFPSRLAVTRGAFIEDTVGLRAREQMKEGRWAKWACWLYYPDEGRRPCLRHLQGRTWRGEEGERQAKEEFIERNRMMMGGGKEDEASGCRREEGCELDGLDGWF